MNQIITSPQTRERTLRLTLCRRTVSATPCGRCTVLWPTGTPGLSFPCCSDQSPGGGSCSGATIHMTNQSSMRDTSRTLRTSRCWWRESRSPWPWPRPRPSPGWGPSSGTRCQSQAVNTPHSGQTSTGPAWPGNTLPPSTITQVTLTFSRLYSVTETIPRYCQDGPSDRPSVSCQS